jgi:hypothetical protein
MRTSSRPISMRISRRSSAPGNNGNAAILASLLFPAPAVAQTDTASLTGVVSDSTGALIQKAVVRVTNQGANITVAVFTNDKGFYFVPDLRPGVYSVATAHPGFKISEQSGIGLQNRSDREGVLSAGSEISDNGSTLGSLSFSGRFTGQNGTYPGGIEGQRQREALLPVLLSSRRDSSDSFAPSLFVLLMSVSAGDG